MNMPKRASRHHAMRSSWLVGSRAASGLGGVASQPARIQTTVARRPSTRELDGDRGMGRMGPAGLGSRGSADTVARKRLRVDGVGEFAAFRVLTGELVRDEPFPILATVRQSSSDHCRMESGSNNSVVVFDAKTNLSQLIDRVELGETIVITRLGRPVARLVPYEVGGHREQVREAVEGLLGFKGPRLPKGMTI